MIQLLRAVSVSSLFVLLVGIHTHRPLLHWTTRTKRRCSWDQRWKKARRCTSCETVTITFLIHVYTRTYLLYRHTLYCSHAHTVHVTYLLSVTYSCSHSLIHTYTHTWLQLWIVLSERKKDNFHQDITTRCPLPPFLSFFLFPSLPLFHPSSPSPPPSCPSRSTPRIWMHRGNARNAYPYQGGTGDRQAPPVMGGPQRRQSVSRQHHPSLGVKACRSEEHTSELQSR